MADPVLSPQEIRLQKIVEIERINRTLTRGVTEVREEDRAIKRDLVRMRERRDELLAEIGGTTAIAPEPASRVRQIRMVGSKGY